MPLRIQKVVEQAGNWLIKEETLSDKSKVYNVVNRSDTIGFMVEIAAVDFNGAQEIVKVLNHHAV